MVLRQCVSLPAAIANRSLFRTNEFAAAVHFASRRGLHSVSNPRTARLKVNGGMRKKVSVEQYLQSKPLAPAISLTGNSATPNVYRDFSDGDDEAEAEGSVIQLQSRASKQKKKKEKKEEAKKEKRKPLRFSDSSEDEQDTVKGSIQIQGRSSKLVVKKEKRKPLRFSDSSEDEQDTAKGSIQIQGRSSRLAVKKENRKPSRFSDSEEDVEDMRDDAAQRKIHKRSSKLESKKEAESKDKNKAKVARKATLRFSDSDDEGAEVKAAKVARRPLQVSDPEEDEEEHEAQEAEGQDIQADNEQLENAEEQEEAEEETEDKDGDPKEMGTRARNMASVLGLPQERDTRGILFEKYIPEHLQGQRTQQLFGSNIHVRLAAPKVLLYDTVFIKSSTCEEECPKDGLPEFALVGRSNVGKSSLVNLLLRRKKLAQVSKSPGKTQLINHFLVNKSWYLVDLPGYGYAKAPKGLCVEWNEFTRDYFLKRKNLVMVVQLVDPNVPVHQIDLDCATWLRENNIPMTLAFTKCDKKKKKKKGGRHPVEGASDFLQRLRLLTPRIHPWVLTSCNNGQGRDELMLHMQELRNVWHS